MHFHALETSEVKKQSQSKSLVFNSELLEKEKDTNSQMGEGTPSLQFLFSIILHHSVFRF